jgi:hypothetical protein
VDEVYARVEDRVKLAFIFGVAEGANQMQTECRNEKLEFQARGARQVVAEFNGGTITSVVGVLLLKEVEAKRKIIKQFAACNASHRDLKLIVLSAAVFLLRRFSALRAIAHG